MEFSVEAMWEDVLFDRLLAILSVQIFRLGCGASTLGCWCPTFRDSVVHEPCEYHAVSKCRVCITQRSGGSFQKNGDPSITSEA